MNSKYKKRGFTIVELVIVIAVIAILSAILIPTFVNLIDKAKRTADERAVAQLNEVVAVEEAATTISKDEKGLYNVLMVYDVVKEHSLLPDYTPVSKNLDTCYDNTTNRFLLYDTESKDVVFPKNLIASTGKISSVLHEFDADNPVRGFYKLGEVVIEPEYDGIYRYTRDKVNEYESLLEKNTAEPGQPEKYEPLTGLNLSSFGGYGLYYKEGKIFTGSIEDTSAGLEPKTYNYQNGMLVVDAEITDGGGSGYSTTLTIPSDIDPDYKTKQVIVKVFPGEDWFDAFANGGNNCVNVNIEEENYTLTNINADFDKQEKIDRLELIVKNMHSGDDDVRDAAFKEAKEFIDDIYENNITMLPNITASKYFTEYLTLTDSESYESYRNNLALSKEPYSGNQQNISFTTYLLGKYGDGATSLIGDDYNFTTLSWNILYGGLESPRGDANGIVGGNVASQSKVGKWELAESKNDYKVVEPELVLLYWKFAYGVAGFVGIEKYEQEKFYNAADGRGDKLYDAEYGEDRDWIEGVKKDPYFDDIIELASWIDIAKGNFNLPEDKQFRLISGFNLNFWTNLFQLYNDSYLNYYFTFTDNSFGE